jgi:hypothetical protein
LAHEESDAPTTRTEAAFGIGGSIAGPDVHGLCRRLRVCLEESCADVVVCDVGALCGADAVALDALARLQLTARRLGCCIRLRDASPELRELLAFAGLNDLFAGDAGLRLRASGKAEEREQQLRVEERVEPDDPTV